MKRITLACKNKEKDNRKKEPRCPGESHEKGGEESAWKGKFNGIHLLSVQLLSKEANQQKT